MPDKKEILYNKLKEKGLYSKSLSDFNTQFSTPEKVQSLYQGLNDKGLYKKSVTDFESDFFSDIVKKKDSSIPVSKNIAEVSTTPSATFQDTKPTGIGSVLKPKTQKFGLGMDAGIQDSEPQAFNPFQNPIQAETPIPFTPSGEQNTDPLQKQQMLQTQNKSFDTINTGGGGFEQTGNFGGYSWNQLLNGFGSLASGVSDQALVISDKSKYQNPITFIADKAINGDLFPKIKEENKPTDLMSFIGSVFGVFTDNEKEKKAFDDKLTEFRGGTSEKIRNYLTDNIGANVDPETEREYQEGTFTGAIGGLVNSVPAIAATALTGNLSPFFIQGYDSALQSLEGKDVDNETRTVYATGIGYVGAKLEKLGFDKVFPGVANGIARGLFNKSLKEAADKTAGKVTGNVIDEYIDQNIKGLTQKFAKFGSKTAQAFIAEYGTGSAQELVNIGGEYLLNAKEGKNIFDTEDLSKWEGFVNNIARANKAGVMEGIGGGVMGAGASIISPSSKKTVVAKEQIIASIDEQLNNEALPENAKILLLQSKIKIQEGINEEVKKDEESQKQLSPAKLKEVKLLSEKITEIEGVLNDEQIDPKVKALLQIEYNDTVKLLEQTNPTQPVTQGVAQPQSNPLKNEQANEVVPVKEEAQPVKEQAKTAVEGSETDTEVGRSEGKEKVKFKIGDTETFYHASSQKRNGRLRVSNAPQFGTGVYFSTDENTVKGEFGDSVTSAELNLDKPVYTNTNEWKSVQERAIELADAEYGKKKGLELSEDDTYFRYDKNNLSEIDEIPSNFISDAAKELGYDAIIDKDSNTYGNEVVVLDESKIVYPEGKEQSEVVKGSNPVSDVPIPVSEVGNFEKAISESLLAKQQPTVKPTASKGEVEVKEMTEAEYEKENRYKDDTPEQLAEKYNEEAKAPSILSEKEAAIWENPLPITRASYVRFGDKNNITLSKAKAYFSKKGQKGFTADQIAQTINDTYFGGEEYITTKDVVDFMDRFPNGYDSVSLPSSNANLQAIREAYYEKTGRKDLNRGTAKKLVEAIKKTEGGKIDTDIVSLVDRESITLDNINEFKNVFDFLYDTEQESNDIFNRVKNYLENEQRTTTTEGKSDKGTEDGSGNDNQDGGLGRETVEPTKPKDGRTGNGDSYESRLKEANQSVKEKETEVAKLQAEYDKASKSLKKNLTENQVGIFENKPQSLFNDQSSQDKIVRERKNALDKAKQDLLDAKVEAESVKDSKNQKEFSWDELLDQSEVAPITDFLDGLKINQSNVPFSKILPVVELYNAAIEIIKVAVKTGNTLRKAVKLAVDHLRQSGATEAQIKGFENDIKGKIGIDKELNNTIKQNIKEATDSRSKAKIVMDELSAIKKQMQDFGKGFKEGEKDGAKTQKDKDAAYDQLGQDVREKLIQVVKNIKALKLFNGKHISQNGMLGMVKNVLDAGNSPRKLATAIDYITKRLEVMDYDNKVRQAKSDIDFLLRKFFKGNQITVSKFLSIDPSQVPANGFVDYLNAIADLKAHVNINNPFQINNFAYISNVTGNFITPTTNVNTSNQPTPVAMTVNMEKPTETFKEKVAKGLKDFHRKWIDFRRGMDRISYGYKGKMFGNINFETRKAIDQGNLINDLLKKNPDIKSEDINDALEGNTDAFGLFPIEISDAVIKMRRHIDSIAQMMIDNGLVSETQKATLEVNLGKYLNRSYQLFSNKNWTLEKLPEPLYNKASQLLYNQYYPQYRIENPNLSLQETDLAVKARVEAKIREYFSKDDNNFFNQKSDGSKDLGIMQQRNEIPIELRELFGEVKDPVLNYLNTIHKMASLAQSAQFLKNVREAHLGTLMFEKNDPNRPADAAYQIAAEGSESLSPLGGLYMSKELAESFKDTDEKLGKVAQHYVTAIGYVKAGKTVGSVITHFKNVEGNIGFMLSNGHWPNKDFGTAIKLAFSEFTGKSNEQILKELEPWIRRGVVGNSVIVGEINAVLDPNKSTAQLNQRIFGRNKTLGEKVRAKLFWTGKKIKDAYQAEDDMFKLFSVMQDQKRYADALYNKKVADLTDVELNELNDKVAEYAKNGYPAFDRVAEIARIGSKYIPLFGNFVGFQSESYRVSFNLGKLAYEEAKSDNPKLRKIGRQRLLGMAAYHSAKSFLIYSLGSAGIAGLQGLVGLMAGDDEKEEQKSIKSFLPPFSQNSDIIAFDFNKNDGTFQYVDLGSYDPFGTQMKVLNVLASGGNINSTLFNTAVQIVEPFVGTEITADMLLGLNSNLDNYDRPIYNKEDDASFIAKDVAMFVAKTVEPGTLSWLRRMATKGDANGEIKAVFYRTYKVNVPLQYSFKMQNYRDRLKDIDYIYKKEYYNKDSTPESRRETYERANQKAKDLILEMKEVYKLAIHRVNDKSVIDKVLNDMKVPKKLKQNIQYDFINNYDIKDKENIIPKSRQPDK